MRKVGHRGSTRDECARGAEGRRDGERRGGNAQPAALHLFWRLNQLAFHFAPIQLVEQTPSELCLAVVHITETPRFFGKAQFLAELLLVEAQVKMFLTPYPQLLPK